jgi:hypothetical protein
MGGINSNALKNQQPALRSTHHHRRSRGKASEWSADLSPPVFTRDSIPSPTLTTTAGAFGVPNGDLDFSPGLSAAMPWVPTPAMPCGLKGRERPCSNPSPSCPFRHHLRREPLTQGIAALRPGLESRSPLGTPTPTLDPHSETQSHSPFHTRSACPGQSLACGRSCPGLHLRQRG